MALHIAIRLPQVCSSLWVSLKGEPGPARVVGRPCGSPFLSILVPKKGSKVFRRGLKMSMSHFCRAWWARWGLGSLAGGKRYHFSPGYTTGQCSSEWRSRDKPRSNLRVTSRKRNDRLLWSWRMSLSVTHVSSTQTADFFP